MHSISCDLQGTARDTFARICDKTLTYVYTGLRNIYIIYCIYVFNICTNILLYIILYQYLLYRYDRCYQINDLYLYIHIKYFNFYKLRNKIEVQWFCDNLFHFLPYMIREIYTTDVLTILLKSGCNLKRTL